MGKKIADEIINQIPVLFKEGHSKKEIAEQLSISVSTVQKYLKLFEAIPETKKKKLTQEEIDRINSRYSEIRNMNQVAKEMGISPSTVRAHLTEENLNLKNQEKEDRDALFFYIYRLFGQYSEEQPINPWNIVQMQKFKSQGMPYKGQLLTLKYFYEVKHNSIAKSRGSIGIISYVFDEAKYFYEKQAAKAKEINEGIKRQLAQDRIEININPDDYLEKKKNKKRLKPIDLATLEEG